MGTIAVTGAASGIGAACTARLVADGHEVIGVDLREVDVICDLGTTDGRQQCIDALADLSGGRLDGLVTCAGLIGLPDRPGSPLVSVNYFGTVELLAGLQPVLAAGTEPAAVAISSNSTTCQPDLPVELIETCLAGDEEAAAKLADDLGALVTYASTKVAVARWVRRTATKPEWIGAGIRLNAIAPGLIDTPMVAAGRADPAMAPMLDQFPIPVGRPGRAEEMAALVAFLLGRDARFFCGSVIFADGGTDALLRTDDWPAPWVLS